MSDSLLLAAANSVATPTGPIVPIEDLFNVNIYKGTGAAQTITTGMDISTGGLIWIKRRDAGSASHVLIDTVRGAENKLSTVNNTAQVNAGAGALAFTPSGLSINTSATDVNISGGSFVMWTFKCAPKFFGIVSWVGDGTAQKTIAHTLGIAPGMVLCKASSAVGDWIVYHSTFTAGQYAKINSTAAIATSTPAPITCDANNLTVAQNGTDPCVLNQAGVTYVAYLFADDPSPTGLIRCGSYVTNASGNASVSLGWEPQYLLNRAVSPAGSNWLIRDIIRGFWGPGSGVASPSLSADTTSADTTSTTTRISSSGITVNGTTGSTNLIFMAIRRGPMRKPTSGTQVYAGRSRTGTGSATTITGIGFPPDILLVKSLISGGAPTWWDRLRGPAAKVESSNALVEANTSSSVTSFDIDGISVGTVIPNATNTYNLWFLKRAPGVIDEVIYTGTGLATDVPHALGVTPELIIIKSRNNASGWPVYSAVLGEQSYLMVNNTGAAVSDTTIWNSTKPTSSKFTIGASHSLVNLDASTTYLAYLFATLAGVSKVFSYTGNGGSQTINCGFSAGARLVIIKRTDASGDWYIWSDARGITAGTDPYHILNSTAAEVTTDDSIDPNPSGFVIKQTATTNVNVTGGTYVGFAIA